MDTLKQKTEELLELANKYQPRAVKTPDTTRSINLIQQMAELDSVVEEIKKETEKHKKKLGKELASHKRMMDKLFSVLEPTTTTTPTHSRYKPWMVTMWKEWRSQKMDGQTWDSESLRQSVKHYSVEGWKKKEKSLVDAGILTKETDGSLTVNLLPASLTEEGSE